MTATLHATLTFSREIAASREAVFAVLADPEARAELGTPSDTAAFLYDATDFREGGEDRFRCGPKANPNIHGTTRYLDIVRNERIVSVETIVVEGKRLCASMSTHFA